MTLTRMLQCSTILLALASPAVAEPARGSITIDRIANIKYPTSPTWSPDGKTIAFLWDAAGKQDLFVVTPGGTPVRLTDFPVDPDLLLSDISAFAWASNTDILFGKDGQLWSVSVSAPTPQRAAGFADAGSFTLSMDRKQIAFVRRGQIWIGSVGARTQRQLTYLPDGLNVFRRPLARVHGVARWSRTGGAALERTDGALVRERRDRTPRRHRVGAGW
jgi:hypothetical protein